MLDVDDDVLARPVGDNLRHTARYVSTAATALAIVSGMEPVIGVFVVLHLLGMASIVGGWLALRLGGPKGLVPLVWGARAQVVLGLILVGLLEMAKEDVSYAKIGVKFAIALAVAACAEIASVRARRGTPQPRLVDAAAALAVVNVMVAVLWQTGS